MTTMNALLLPQILFFAFTLWLGLYLAARDASKPLLLFTGLGLLSYALGLALDTLYPYAPNPAVIEALRWPLRFAPALLWFAASAYLLPDERIAYWAGRGALLDLLLLYPLSLIAGVQKGTPLYWAMAIVVLLCLLLAFAFTWRAFRRAEPKKPLVALLTVALFFTLSAGLFILPVNIFPAEWVLVALGLDMLTLGGCIGLLDAFDEGQAFLPDFLHAFAVSGLAMLVFGGQVLLAMSWSGGVTLPLLVLLFAILTAAAVAQVFSQRIQSAIDALVFARFARLRQARSDLRSAAEALPRMNVALDLAALGEDEFTRLTRRALSHMTDAGKLAASPLTRLPIIESRLAARRERNNTLERAAELKALLAESIARLKPRDKGAFGTSDEWRYYNALYFPYVLGIKPYTRGVLDESDPRTQAVVEWFRVSVPERTLHNWQNAAARLVARDLRESQ